MFADMPLDNRTVDQLAAGLPLGMALVGRSETSPQLETI
jgi:hypothetical protein